MIFMLQVGYHVVMKGLVRKKSYGDELMGE